MKKWIVALVLCLAVGLALGVAVAEGIVLKNESGTVLADGASLSGKFYYRVYVENLPEGCDGIETGWSEDMTATTTEDWEWRELETDDSGNRFITVFPWIEGEYNKEIMFARVDGDSPVRRIKVNYKRTPVSANAIQIASEDGPALYQRDYTLRWDAVDGVEFYNVVWDLPGDDYRVYYPHGAENWLDLSDVWGEPTDCVGRYRVKVFAFASGRLQRVSGDWEFEIAPVLSLADYNEDFVQAFDDGSGADILLNQWVDFTVNAPGAHYIRVYSMYPEQTMDEAACFADCGVNEDGNADIHWIEVGYSEDTQKEIVAVAHYGDGESVESNRFILNIGYDGEIGGNIAYSVPGDVNTKKNGRWQVARDGRLFVDVNNALVVNNADEADRNDVRAFGLYIAGEDEDGPWLADSHWVWLSDGDDFTRVPLTVPRCEVGKNYEVRVFAVRFGSPWKDAVGTIPIRVTEAADPDNPIILSMGDSFVCGEPLRVFAHYTNPDNIEGDMEIRIYRADDPENVYYDEHGEFNDYWDESACIWDSGEYVVEGRIWEYGDPEASLYQGRDFWELKRITVNSNGLVAAPQVDPITDIPAGQDLTLALTATSDGDAVMPDWFEAEVFRADGGFWYIDRRESKDFTIEEIDGVESAVGTITFPADRFDAFGKYYVRLYGMKYGCEAGIDEFRFVVTGAESEQSLRLTVDGSDEPYQEFNSSTDLYVKVDGFDEGHRPTVVRILNGGDWEFWWGEDENFDRNWGFGDDEIVMYAEASWDDIDFDELDRNGWRDFDWNRDVNWTARSNAIRLIVTSPFGEMIAPRFDLGGLDENDSIAWGDQLTITVQDPAPMAVNPEDENDPIVVPCGWFFCNLDVERTDEDGNTWWERYNRWYNYDIHSGVNVIPTYNLEDGCHYRIEIGADAPGYGGRSEWREFSVGEKPAQQEPNIASFTINGSSEDQTVETYTELSLAAYYSNAEWDRAEWYRIEIRRQDDEDWYEERNNCDSGMLMDSWRANEEGTYILTAFAYWNLPEGQRDEEGRDYHEEEIGSITLTANAPHGDMAAPDVAMPDKAYLDDRVPIFFNGPDDAEYFNYWVHPDDDGRWVNGGGCYGTGETYFNTRRMESGVYWVEFDAQKTGYNQSHTTLHLALLDENDLDWSSEEGGYYFTISAASVETEVSEHIIAYIGGTDAVRVYYQKYDEDTETGGPLEWLEERDGPGLDTWFNWGESGTYRLYISGHYGDSWSEPTMVGTIEVTADNILKAPTVTVNGSSKGDVASADEENPQKLSVSIRKNNAVENYHVRIHELGEGWNFYDQDNDPNEYDGDYVNLGIEHECIQPGRVYVLHCDAHARGYECSYYERTFLLQPDGDEGLDLTVSPTSDDGYWTAEEARVWAHAEGATAIRICMPGEARCYRGDEAEDDFTIWDQDTMFYAYATTDPIPEDDDFDWDELDVNWRIQATPIRVYANTEGDTQVPSLSFEPTVIKGDWFEFTIEDDGDARQMDVRIRDDDGNEYEFRRLWAPGTYVLPTANLSAGRRYWVYLCCVQSRHLWTNGPDYPLNVVEPGEDAAFFRVDKAELYSGEHFIPTVYAPGAEHIWIADEYWEKDPNDGYGVWGDWEGDNGTNNADWEWWFDDPGEYQLTAYARYPGSDALVVIGTVDITVLEQQRLAQAEIVVDNVVSANGFEVAIPLVEGGYYYELQVHQTDMENKYVYHYRRTADDADGNTVYFWVPDGEDAEAHPLDANASYWIDCYIDPRNGDYRYCGSDSSKNVMTMEDEAFDGGLRVKIEEAYLTDGGYRVPVNHGFEAVVRWLGNAGQAPAAIALYMGDHVEYRFFNGEAEVFGISEYQDWPEVIFARGYYGDLSGYDSWEAVPWGELAWSAPSEPVQVTFYSYGQAEPAHIDHNGVVMAGHEEYIVVNVTLGDHANEAHANLDRNLSDWREDLVYDGWLGWDPDDAEDPRTGTIILPLEDVGAGTYRLYVDNSGDGYTNSRAYGWLHVVEDPYQSGSKLVLPAGLKQIEEEAFEGIAADTVIIPDGVTSIGPRAFKDSGVRKIVIPNSVRSIGEDAFAGSDLEVVYGFRYDGPAMQLTDDYAGVVFYCLD